LLACGGQTSAGPGATAGDGGVTQDAGGQTSCADLADTAQTAFAPVAAQHLACQVDTDCLWTPVDKDGWCVAPCGVLTDQASVGAVISAAGNACAAFNAQSCTAPDVACFRGPALVCAGGTCTAYSIGLAQLSPSLSAGACAAFELTLDAPGSPDAPHDIPVTLTASGGTLYVDKACTTALDAGSLAIPAGSQAAPFGFVPNAAGDVSIEYDGTFNSLTVP
jgi:hypothetical protein